MGKLRAFTMPKWGIEMVEGTIGEWNVKVGEPVVKGQVIAQIETDKIVNEVEIEYDTRFVRLIAEPGQTYAVGALLAVTSIDAVEEEEIDAFVRAFAPAGGAATETFATASAATASAATAHREAPVIPAGMLMSPAARELALRLSVNVSAIEGLGRGGRITLQDVDQAARPMRKVGGGGPVAIEPTSEALDAFYASPYAKRLAVKHSVDLAKLAGTGPRGRISRQDVAAAAGLSAVPAPGAAYEILRMSPTRKAIARQLTLSKSTIPHFYLRMSANVDALLVLRAELKRAGGSIPSVNDYFIRAVALALMAAPDLNVQVHGDQVHRFRDADISVAVAADKGLITPVIRAAQTKSVQGISAELRAMIERARAGKLHAEEIEGGSFTVSNLGMFEVDQFDAIINPPQGAILAIGAARLCPVERGGGVSVARVVNFSLSCDHRAIDGAVGAAFLRELKTLLEAPQRL
ncbi:MAG TPA: 2-oxo acid dehydrogenase subunit E2 [Steroidobacteraceae bacterium]|nr:2-oxo acid dehydrogenase subunit E2 [Steroidobacteraceae bacterium]